MNIESVKLVVTHDNCPDGLASAMIIRDILPDVEIKFVQHNTEDHKSLTPQSGILFVDFSPFVPVVTGPDGKKILDPEVLAAWGASGSQILDHHKTSKPIIDAFGNNGRFGDEVLHHGVCGAFLAYDHIWAPNRPDNFNCHLVHKFARLAGVRDTWVRDSVFWNEACRQSEILSFIPKERWLGIPLIQHLKNWQEQYEWIGEILEVKNINRIDKTVDGGYRFVSNKGTRVIIFEGITATSDACEKMGSEFDLVVGHGSFVESGNLVTVFSTRSHSDFDCSAFCKKHGGGGHTKAAGFKIVNSVDSLHPVSEFIRILNNYEAI